MTCTFSVSQKKGKRKKSKVRVSVSQDARCGKG